ncbi:TPA: ATP-binding cassette domain-containing protein [Vibrio parahaemolyticus]|nr:ATP-binding cassette domain-containing protein [Vibrio parahaemolyticus]
MMKDAISKYFGLCGEKFGSGSYIDELEVKTHINDYVKSKLFTYQYESGFFDKSRCPDLFICKIEQEQYCVIKKKDFGFVNITHDSSIELDKLNNKEIFFFRKYPVITDEKELYATLLSMTPKQGLWSVPLILFALMSPLYSNIFNSRLVYSESSYSFLFISSIFIILLALEASIRSIIYGISSDQIRKNNILCDMYWLDFQKIARCRGASIKIRTIDSSLGYIWESLPIIITDIALAMLFMMCLVLLLGKYFLFILAYYVCLSFLLVYVRFKNYKRSLQNNASSYEKLGSNISIEEKREELRFMNGDYFKDMFFGKFCFEEKNKFDSQIENHHWSELIKTNSFISIVILYCACYFSIQNGDINPSIIIALMIINSRLSSCLISITNRIYMGRVNLYHLRESLSGLFKERVTYASSGVSVSNITNFDIVDLTVNAGNNVVLSNFNKKLEPGDILGIFGPSGCGKTTLINTLSGLVRCSSGTIKVNNIAIEQLSEEFFQKKVAYHSANSRFFRGSLLENFTCYGVVEHDEIMRILQKSCPKLSISKETLDKKDVEELSLSNGEKQKLLLELALSKNPDLIFLDESTSFLPSNEAFEIISEIKRTHIKSIIVISTHDKSLLTLCSSSISLGKRLISPNIDGAKVIRVT